MNESHHPIRVILKICLLFAAFDFSNRLAAQEYSLDWFSIDGGGGTSTGGVYSLSGTIGQPDAGAMSGGVYILTGGFWSILSAVQTPGAPRLTIMRATSASAVVSWPNPSTGFVLQEASSLSLSNWTNVAASPSVVSASKQVVISSTVGRRFYRLLKP